MSETEPIPNELTAHPLLSRQDSRTSLTLTWRSFGKRAFPLVIAAALDDLSLKDTWYSISVHEPIITHISRSRNLPWGHSSGKLRGP
jgi:hypothetical protein